jgi:hypothetical protein
MANGYGFERYPMGGTPDARRVGAMLAPQQQPAPAVAVAPAGEMAATGGDGTGTPGLRLAPPNLATMPSQGSSNPTARPETLTVDGDFDPATEHSEAATATAVADMLRRTDGGASGQGQVQNAAPASPLQAYQLQRMGLSPAEIEFMTMGGALKGTPGV